MEKIIIDNKIELNLKEVDNFKEEDSKITVTKNNINYIIDEKIVDFLRFSKNKTLIIYSYYIAQNQPKNKFVLDYKILNNKTNFLTNKNKLENQNTDKFIKDQSINKNEKKSIYYDQLDWNKIYLGLEKYENTFKIDNHKLLQRLIDSTFEENKRVLYITKPKLESIDLKALSFFDIDDLEEFIYYKKNSFTIREKEPIIYDEKNFNLSKTKSKYENFIRKTWLIDLENEEIDNEEFIDKINDAISRKFKKINTISRQANRYFIETGNWSTYVGWPFVVGKINDNFIRTPLAYFPIQIEKTATKYILKHQDRPIKINAQLVKSIYHSQRKEVEKLEIDFDNLTEILKEYWKHGIEFDNQLNELIELKKIPKEEFKTNNTFEKLKIENIFYIENKVFSEYIWQDSISILRNFKNFSIPRATKKIFEDNEKIEHKNNLFLNIDKNKSFVVAKALKDSLVIQGPPGTGKSETITALLCLLAEQGKSNILVSEKDSALTVVVQRLQEKYNLHNFALKLNGENFSKKEFWTKIKNNLNEIQRRKNKLQLIHNNEEFLEVLKINNEIVLQIKNSNIKTQNFWNYLSLYCKYEKLFLNSQITFEERYKEFEKDFTKLKNYETKISNLKNENKKIEIFNVSMKSKIYKNEQKINKILKPDFCNLEKRDIDFDYLQRQINNKKIFKYLSNGHWNFLERNKKYKENINKIINLKKLLKDKNYFSKQLKEIDWNILNKNNDQILELDAKIKWINKIYKLNDLKIFNEIKEFQNFEIERKNALFKLEKLFLNSLKHEKDFYLDKKYKIIKQKIKNIYSKNKAIIKNNLINSIQEKIKNNEKLELEFENLRNLSFNFQKIPKPTIVFEKYFNVIKILFPFILSTPSEVSKYIPNDPNIFDYGIFDEASQIKKEKAMPTIHRSKKIIVAGDKKQLGPSNFFSTKLDDDQELLIQKITDTSLLADSLLSWAESKYENVLLNYHYRSLSSRLIEYSNVNFYDSKLIIADSPNSKEKPIQPIKLNGFWDLEKKINEVEGKKTIEILKNKLNFYEKIGVVTMNRQQRDYIEDLINRDSKLYKEFFRNNIFVKNIENVQGDEADLIIFSLQYSTNNNEKPINVWNGLSENRLNVSITRSKKKMIILKSFDSYELGKGNKGSARNVLYKWIKWIEEQNNFEEKNTLAYKWNNDGKSRSPFEEEFILLLEKEIPSNIKILNNFKISGYEIDIVLFDKENNKFISLIELDGKSFHNSVEQINKDYEKTTFLEELNWKIRRISSNEFYRNKNDCIQEVMNWFDDIVNYWN